MPSMLSAFASSNIYALVSDFFPMHSRVCARTHARNAFFCRSAWTPINAHIPKTLDIIMNSPYNNNIFI